MEPIIKSDTLVETRELPRRRGLVRRFFEWLRLDWLLRPVPSLEIDVRTYLLAYKFRPTARERQLIDQHGLWEHAFFTPIEGEPPRTFEEALQAGAILSDYPEEILNGEMRIRHAAFKWTHHFEQM